MDLAAGGTFPATIWQRFMAPALEPFPAAGWEAPAATIAWKRWCGRYQFARSEADAKARNGCPKKPKKRTLIRAGRPEVDDDEPTETVAAPVPPPLTEPAAPPPTPTPALTRLTRALVGELGTVTVAITLDRDGEAEAPRIALPGQEHRRHATHLWGRDRGDRRPGRRPAGAAPADASFEEESPP